MRVREALDTGTAIDDSVSVVSVGATLIELLRSLDDSVVPTALFPHAEFHNVPVAVWCVQPRRVWCEPRCRGTPPHAHASRSPDTTRCGGGHRPCVSATAGLAVIARCRNLLQKLDVASYNTFTYVICFARELLAHAGTNELTADVAGVHVVRWQWLAALRAGASHTGCSGCGTEPQPRSLARHCCDRRCPTIWTQWRPPHQP